MENCVSNADLGQASLSQPARDRSADTTVGFLLSHVKLTTGGRRARPLFLWRKPMAFWSWSRTAANNANADNTINWAEGQSPSSVNDSARAMMAALAAFRDDAAGAIATGGTSTAYTVTSYETFDTLAHMANQVVAFVPHATNGGTTTLNVDCLGAKPLRPAPSVELAAGALILGTPYIAVYNNSDAMFYLWNF